MSFPRSLVKGTKLVLINILVFFSLFLCLEIGTRVYVVLFHNGSFLRTPTFVSPWITTYDSPPPIIRSDGEAYFRHRDLPTPTEKPADTIRIIAVGGSTTANERPYKISRVDYAQALAARLRRQFDDVPLEVLNAGAKAYSTAHSLINIEFRLVEFQPDIIILMHNINDSSVNAFSSGTTSDYSNKYLQPLYLDPSLQSGLSFPGFLMQSRLLSELGLPQLLAKKSADLNVGNDCEFGLRVFRRNLATIASICDLHDIDLVLLSQPYTLEPHKYVRRDVVEEYNRALPEVAREHGAHFFDMFAAFGHEKAFFVDQFHFSPSGIERFSAILSSELAGIVSARIARNGNGNSDE